MSDGMNKVILLGNLGADPELKHAPSTGTPILSLRLATNESWVDRDKNVQERTEWHTVVVFGPRAEALSKILTKGSSVLVEGGLRTSSYEKDGQKRWRTEIHAREICLAGRRPGGAVVEDAPPQPGASRKPNGRAHAPQPALHDELPF
jgi:single-strand DNA-binding protein